MSNYWKQRQRDITYNRVLQRAEKELANEYEKCLNKTRIDIELLYDEIKIASRDGTLLISDLYKYNRYYELMNELNKHLTLLGRAEIKIYGEYFERMYFDNSQLITDELGYYKKSQIFIDENNIKNALNAIWCQDGKHWSNRVWDNKALLQERIKNGLVDCVARGVSKDELVKRLIKDMGVGFYEASRIARTELTFIQNQSTYDKYKEAGIQQYQFLAELDDRTSQVCRETHGKIFDMDQKQVGINYPPLHPNCRSTVLAVIN